MDGGEQWLAVGNCSILRDDQTIIGKLIDPLIAAVDILPKSSGFAIV